MRHFQLHDVELGVGGYGRVLRVTNSFSGEQVAAKVIDMSLSSEQAIEHEVQMLQKVTGHVNVIGYRGFVEEDDQTCYIFMELAMGYDLFGVVQGYGSLTEEETRPLFRQIMRGVTHLHQIGVVHRDLKLENILLDEHDTVKLCDFGLAHAYEIRPLTGEPVRLPLHRVCGSTSYMAPEILLRQAVGYDGEAADVWSCGVVLFGMLAGRFPFDRAGSSDPRFPRVCRAALNGESITHTAFMGFGFGRCPFSSTFVSLLDQMLHLKADCRCSAESALQTAWLATGETRSHRLRKVLRKAMLARTFVTRCAAKKWPSDQAMEGNPMPSPRGPAHYDSAGSETLGLGLGLGMPIAPTTMINAA